MKLPLRTACALVAALGSYGTVSAQSTPVVVEAESGASTNPATPAAGATGKAKYLGSAYSTAQSLYFDKYWNAVTPENGGKWAASKTPRHLQLGRPRQRLQPLG